MNRSDYYSKNLEEFQSFMQQYEITTLRYSRKLCSVIFESVKEKLPWKRVCLN